MHSITASHSRLEQLSTRKKAVKPDKKIFIFKGTVRRKLILLKGRKAMPCRV